MGQIACRYTSYADDETDYPNMYGQKQKGRMPLPADTKASRGHNIGLDGVSNQKKVIIDKKPFKMAKFQGVNSKLYE